MGNGTGEEQRQMNALKIKHNGTIDILNESTLKPIINLTLTTKFFVKSESEKN